MTNTCVNKSCLINLFILCGKRIRIYFNIICTIIQTKNYWTTKEEEEVTSNK